MPRSYRYIKEYEEEILRLREQGKINREIRINPKAIRRICQ